MTLHAPAPTALFSAIWPIRLDACRNTAWQNAALTSILRDAREAGDEDIARAAQGALDGGELDELDWLFAEAERIEEIEHRAYRYECRTGRDAPYWMGAGW